LNLKTHYVIDFARLRPVIRTTVFACSVGLAAGALTGATPAEMPPPAPPASVDATDSAGAKDILKQFIDGNATPIDLGSALRLAGEQNNQILIAQQRVLESVAARQLAAAQFLPNLNLGTNVDSHTGVLQQSSGKILKVSRESFYIGAGANAVAAGSVNIPGLTWTMNLSDGIYAYLISRREVERREFENRTVEQDTMLQVAVAYNNLLRAEGNRRVAEQTSADASDVARVTAAYLKVGQGRKADADRAATEFSRREAFVVGAEGQVGTESSRLCKLLHLDPSMRLKPVENNVLPMSVVPEPIPLAELLAIAMLNRPELNERRTAIAQALLALQGSQTLPFSPTVFIGFSAGEEGGGSNLVAQPTGTSQFARSEPRFGNYAGRQDLDIYAYWTLLNMGCGNRSMIQAARSRLRSANLRELIVLDRVRAEVAAAYAKTHARFAQIQTAELAIRSGLEAFQEDRTRIIGNQGLPLELMNSLRLLARARVDYLNAIVDYNTAQFELYVALGKPPADVLVRPAAEEIPMRPVPPAPR
jgi:outer membrane protein TolC